MSCFRHFQADISGIALPSKFTFPFYYDPHPLTLIAAKEVQAHLEKHQLQLGRTQEGLPIGKMFGVLVVQNHKQEVGYLAGYSGKLAHKDFPGAFVPPVYNVHDQRSFFAKGEQELNALNKQIDKLENDAGLLEAQKTVEAKTLFVTNELKRERGKMKASKKERKVRREEAEKKLSPEVFTSFNKKLAEESIKSQLVFKNKSKDLKSYLLKYEKELAIFTSRIAELKAERKNKSVALQQQIFESFQFLNPQKVTKKLTEIFPNFREQNPPAGSGECSAPKLLQYAFSNDLKPIAMGEFWWGPSPKTEIRKHKNFYPACGGRCKPILAHMLDGVEMDDNPFLKNPAENKEIDIIFEDDSLLVLNKPAEFLSVPGKEISDSVYTRMKSLFPDATGPLIVHRLDMSTSGILVIAKTKDAHKFLQRQFAKRTLKKRYVALLDGEVEGEEGFIDLPLRVDLDDRPRQLVCYEYGKTAKTRWKVVERLEGKTRVHLYPITGRTHQLRVHAAHPLGLNTAIVGDDLYGQKANRLHLHAAFIEFTHPANNEKISFSVKADF